MKTKNLIHKAIISLMLILICNSIVLGQFEIVELRFIQEQKLIKKNDVKIKIKFQKFRNEVIETGYIYYSKNGNIDSTKYLDPRWMMSCPTPGSKKIWITNKFNNHGNLKDKEEQLKFKLNRPDFRIDSMITEQESVNKNYFNSQNLFEHYYKNTSDRISLRTIFSYDDELKIQTKIVYKNYLNNTSTRGNGTTCTYYIYDENGLLKKEITNEIDIEKVQIKNYSYYNSKLVKSISTDYSEFSFEYIFYK